MLRDVIRQKCEFKRIEFPTLDKIQLHRDELFSDWGSMLAHQLPQLPPIESFWNSLAEFFRWLNDQFIHTTLKIFPRSDSDETLSLPVGSIRLSGRSSAFLEVIRFAGGNRLCVELDYTNQKGERRPRIIEPYSIRRTKENNLLLMGREVNSGKDKSYRVDQIYGATMTNRTFEPKYQIELTPSLSVTAPNLSRPKKLSDEDSSLSNNYLKLKRGGSKIVYTYRCSVCGKKFKHSRQSSALRAHKNKSGRNCYGKTGIYEGSKSE